jgi:hypothetical protein
VEVKPQRALLMKKVLSPFRAASQQDTSRLAVRRQANPEGQQARLEPVHRMSPDARGEPPATPPFSHQAPRALTGAARLRMAAGSRGACGKGGKRILGAPARPWTTTQRGPAGPWVCWPPAGSFFWPPHSICRPGLGGRAGHPHPSGRRDVGTSGRRGASPVHPYFHPYNYPDWTGWESIRRTGVRNS